MPFPVLPAVSLHGHTIARSLFRLCWTPYLYRWHIFGAKTIWVLPQTPRTTHSSQDLFNNSFGSSSPCYSTGVQAIKLQRLNNLQDDQPRTKAEPRSQAKLPQTLAVVKQERDINIEHVHHDPYEVVDLESDGDFDPCQLSLWGYKPTCSGFSCGSLVIYSQLVNIFLAWTGL